MAARRHPRPSYNVGIVCALDVEKAAVEATLDEEHEGLPKMTNDDNVYTLGRIGRHNVVVACLPAGVTGKASAATVAKDMMRSFPIKAGLMVGICGGVWSERADIRLGDVVVSQPDGMHGGVVQWDFGKMEKEGVFRRTGTLDKPPRPLLNAVQSLKSKHRLRGNEVARYIQEAFAKFPRIEEEYRHQGQDKDNLYEASYSHPEGDKCDRCDRSRLVRRLPDRRDDKPKVHYGNIASGDEVVKDGPTRDRIAREEGVLCFEMEAAGLMDSFPCVVVRGVCDYADSHKNKRWQAYAAMTAACYAKELLGVVDQQGVEELRVVNYSIPFSLKNVPVTDHFVQRDAEMNIISTFFQSVNEKKRRRIFVIHGMGGIGKTQLCVEFVRKHKDDFDAIFWLDGTSKDALRQSLASAALRLPEGPLPGKEMPPQRSKDVDEAIGAFVGWLSSPRNMSWLLVLDNVDLDWQGKNADSQAYNYKDFLPPADHGNVLLTTRLARLQKPEASLHLDKVSDDLGRKILETRANKPLLGVEPLLEKLGGLPLALVQAGAYLRETGMLVNEYLQHYGETWAALMNMQNQFPLQEYAERSVLTTWRMSYQQARVSKPEAADLLDLWAFLSPGDIWYELVASTSEKETTTGLGRLTFRHLLGVLSNYSLTMPDEQHQRFSIHPVVHAWCLHNIKGLEERQQLCNRAVSLVVEKVPLSESKEDMVVARRLLPHARMAAERQLAIPGNSGLKDESYHIANFLKGWESSRRVERLYLRVLGERKKALGAKHKSTLDAVHDLGILYRQQGKLKEAQEMFERALEGYEEALGAKHTSTLDAVHSLSNLYSAQSKLKDAQDMIERALEGYEEALGAKHTSTLNAVHDLGILYRQQGKLKEAQEMFERALEGYEEALGAKHTSTLLAVKNLGILYRQQGKLKEAAEMLERALKGYEEALGAKHTSTLDAVHSLSNLYSAQGKLKEAQEMLERALEGYEEALGAKHTSTLNAVHNLGILYRNQGKLKEAQEMFERALEGYEEALGAKHTSTLNAVLNLGDRYRDQGKLKEAQEMLERALEGYEEALGAKHTLTLNAVNNLGILYMDQGKLKEAQEMYERALEGYEEALGAKHTSTLDAVNNLGDFYREQGKLKEAQEMLERALKGYEEALGAEHASTLLTVNNLGNLYRQQGKLKEAQEMLERALKGYEEAWGAEHTSTLSTVNNLGLLYADQGKMKEAEEMYLRALRGYEEAWGAKHASTLDTVYGLGNLYRDQGEVAKAKDMYERAAEGYEDVEVDREAHIVYIREQLSLLVATDGEAGRGCQPIGQQPLISPAGIPARASLVPITDAADAHGAAGEAPVRGRIRDFFSRVLKR